MRTRTKEQIARQQATLAKRKETRSSQTMVIDDDIEIRRVDDMNWGVFYKGEFEGYYGTRISALKAILPIVTDKMMTKNIEELVRIAKCICDRIDRCLLE
jgi:hypothetical protein